jgi:hypothetical protein
MKLLKASSRRAHQRFAPAPVPGAPSRPPPGVGRPAPRLGGFRGLAVPPELRRRIQGAVRTAAGAGDLAERERIVLRTAQRKLLDSRQKLRTIVAALRAQLTSV